jgi:maltooligosyltrehalose trehalohydrolase
VSAAGWRPSIGAVPVEEGVRFHVWAPESAVVEVVLYGPDAERIARLEPQEGGYHAAVVEGVSSGGRYAFRLDGRAVYPDPASRSQPEGVHAPSEIVDAREHRWRDEAWAGPDHDRLVVYELHVGTFTPEGTFDAARSRLGYLADLGVTAVELMPVAEFSGDHNWGYDGVSLFAPSRRYGGPAGLRRFVDAAHRHGLAVILDVVYNHLGPEGNYLPAVTGGRYFTDRHVTPWGDAINYDGPGSGPVRAFVVENALHWLHEYHLDGLRLDATHAIADGSPTHVLQELVDRVRESVPRRVLLIAEDERNERRLLMPRQEGGFGFDAVWADDFHHEIRSLVAGDQEGYYEDFAGTVEELARVLRRGWLYEGQHSSHHGAGRGTPADGIRPASLVHAIQNHDQVGNRAHGERLNHQIPLPTYRAVSALLLLSPYTPLLWMGQEWAASSPFLYFTDHPEPLGLQITEGRRGEFRHFSAFSDPDERERIPDPQREETFLRSKLDWSESDRSPHAGVQRLYRELLRMRQEEPALRSREAGSFEVAPAGSGALLLLRGEGSSRRLLVVAFGAVEVELGEDEVTRSAGGWRLVLHTEESRFGGVDDAARLHGDRLRTSGPAGVVLAPG